MPALPGSALVEAQVWAAVAVARKRGLEGVTVLQWCRTTLPVEQSAGVALNHQVQVVSCDIPLPRR